jgi:thymidylate kinase
MGAQSSTRELENAPSLQQVKGSVARSLIATLENQCKGYCILSGYDDLPDSFDTDIDFMVHIADFERMPQLIEHVARETNTRLFHTVGHELSARSYSLGFQLAGTLVIVQPDSTADYRHFGLLWLRSQEVLRMRRWHPRGFWIPAAHHEFAYYLIKRLNKLSFDAKHGLRLHRLYLLDPAGCDQMIARYWKGPNRDCIRRMARSNDWHEMESWIEEFRYELVHHPLESLLRRILSGPERAWHHIRRLAFPTGGCIAVIGPDGAGKSAVIEAICEQFRFAYHRVKCFHLRPKLLRPGKETHAPVTDPHGRPARGLLLSVAKLLFMVADYWLGYLLQIAPAMRRSQLIVFDRYFYDVLVDRKRIRYGGPAWLLKFASAVIPRPDLVILLDAPPDMLWSRKQEVAFEEVVRQRSEYLRLAQRLPFARIVNAGQELPAVVGGVDDAIVTYFENRTAARLHLGQPAIHPTKTAIQAPGQ